jgi:aryl-alcohol dehydrogenase-like predicted oxidoreductase
MDYRTLGGTGMKVSPLCLGAMMFGEIGNRDHDDCIRVVHRALDAGVNFIDTADSYSRGESEEIIGKAIKGLRDRLVIATKFMARMGDDVNMGGASRRWIVQEVENSLRRLGTDHIDLYQIHFYDISVDIEEVLFTMTELVRQGKVREIGSSSFPADRIVEAQWTAEKRGTLRFRSEQPGYSIFRRDAERTILPACKRYGMGVLSFSPLDGGFLTGKYRAPDDLTGENRFALFGRMSGRGFDPHAELIHRKLAIVVELEKIAQEIDATLAQMAIAFVLQHPAITSAIIGPRTLDQLEGLLPSTDVKLSDETLDRIDALVPPGTMLNAFYDLPSGMTKDQLRRS